MSLRSLVQLQPGSRQSSDVELGVLARPGSLEQPATPPATAVAAAIARQAAAPSSGSSPAPAPPCYEFKHRFAGQAAVGIIKFAPGSADVLAWADAAGSVFLATAADPPRLLQVGATKWKDQLGRHAADCSSAVLLAALLNTPLRFNTLALLKALTPWRPFPQVLERHQARVSDLDWSPDGTSLLSVGHDGIVCLWRTADGALLRALRNGSGPLCCCRFHPSNPNIALLGTAAGELLALNASTGVACSAFGV